MRRLAHPELAGGEPGCPGVRSPETGTEHHGQILSPSCLFFHSLKLIVKVVQDNLFSIMLVKVFPYVSLKLLPSLDDGL